MPFVTTLVIRLCQVRAHSPEGSGGGHSRSRRDIRIETPDLDLWWPRPRWRALRSWWLRLRPRKLTQWLLRDLEHPRPQQPQTLRLPQPRPRTWDAPATWLTTPPGGWRCPTWRTRVRRGLSCFACVQSNVAEQQGEVSVSARGDARTQSTTRSSCLWWLALLCPAGLLPALPGVEDTQTFAKLGGSGCVGCSHQEEEGGRPGCARLGMASRAANRANRHRVQNKARIRLDSSNWAQSPLLHYTAVELQRRQTQVEEEEHCGARPGDTACHIGRRLHPAATGQLRPGAEGG